MTFEIPLFYHPTYVVAVESTPVITDFLCGSQYQYRTFSEVSEALANINHPSVNRSSKDNHELASILLFGQSTSADKATQACPHIEDKNVQTILLSNNPAFAHNNLFDLVLNPHSKNFRNILLRQIRLLQHKYFLSASKDAIDANIKNMHYFHDDAVADHFDDVCHRLNITQYYYDERIAGFILTQESGDKSIWLPLNESHYSANDISAFKSTKATQEVVYTVQHIQSESRYSCVTIENIIDLQSLTQITSQLLPTLH